MGLLKWNGRGCVKKNFVLPGLAGFLRCSRSAECAFDKNTFQVARLNDLLRSPNMGCDVRALGFFARGTHDAISG